MADSLQHLKQRLGGVKNIGKITKAMELVAATKMRRSQEIAINSRPYAFTALDLLATLSAMELKKLPKVLRRRPIKNTALVLITSDKGLAGSFNSAVIRKFEKYIAENGIDLLSERYACIAVGNKAARYLEKRARVAHAFSRVGDFTSLEEIRPLSKTLTDGYVSEQWDTVIVFSTNFRNALRQDVVMQTIFPVDVEELKVIAEQTLPSTGRFAEMVRDKKVVLFDSSPKRKTDYIIEPTPAELIQKLVPHLIEMHIYHIILEANASEHAARRVAMKNASDNAGSLSDELTLYYNKSRQAVITKELTEISAGAEALT